jgi:D-beta-D-heptose 7-phosphate kinase/D-beta-D-heptose 1-phosphate adenosyltransferase
MTIAEMKEWIGRFPGYRVAVLGDVILDQYIWGHATRISPEAPVPVVRVARRNFALGGAANVMRNIASVGATALAFGVLGDDDSALEFRKLCDQWKVSTDGLVAAAGRKTTVKVRIISDNQQVVRIDEETDDPITPDIVSELLRRLGHAIDAKLVDALILEDYHKGVLVPELAESAIDLCNAKGIPVSLDPHPGNHSPIKGLTVMTPNRVEAFALAGSFHHDPIWPLEEDGFLMEVGRRLRERFDPHILLITLGAGGMALFEEENRPIHIPTVAKEVFDVSGAGDTVIAVYTLALLAGADPRQSAVLANHAAGVVVGKVGTVPVSTEELLASLDEDSDE